jgi:hypothetical protein
VGFLSSKAPPRGSAAQLGLKRNAARQNVERFFRPALLRSCRLAHATWERFFLILVAQAG